MRVHRIISIEMFEHMKNYDLLLKKISTWLKNEGKLFVHIFTHRWKPYHFTDDWMARTFFTGGTMPSHSLLLNFQTDLQLTDQWGVSGTHYEKTLNIWLDKLDQNLDVILPIMKTTYGDKVRKPKLYIYHIYTMTTQKVDILLLCLYPLARGHEQGAELFFLVTGLLYFLSHRE